MEQEYKAILSIYFVYAILKKMAKDTIFLFDR